jgi:aspartate racemase
MKTIGILGGMSWESTRTYYRLINEGVRERLGGLNSARILLDSVNFADVEPLLRSGKWDELGDVLCSHAERLERAGADFLLLATNTMHKLAPRIEERICIPLLHIADAAAEAVTDMDLDTVGLLGTRPTMDEDFFSARLARHGLKAIVPDCEERRCAVHRIIFDELCQGRILDASRRTYEDIIEGLVGCGAQAVILGCTEISLLVSSGPVPLIDTTAVHVRAAVTMALDGLKEKP